MIKITEIIPDNLPEWAEKAMDEGQFFNEALKRSEINKDMLQNVRRKLEASINAATASAAFHGDCEGVHNSYARMMQRALYELHQAGVKKGE